MSLPSNSVDALNEFRPESAFSPTPPARVMANAPAPIPAGPHVSLAELRAGVQMEWYEGLAIVQALCRSIIDSGDQIGPARVDDQDVFISANGTVGATCKGPRNAMEAVQALGTILAGLLPDHDFMFLKARLVAKATSSPPQYTSLQSFSDGMAYYERPNRTELIQDVYNRCRSVPVQPIAVHQDSRTVPATPSEDEAPKEHAHRRARSFRSVALFAIAGTAILGAVVGTVVWTARSPTATIWRWPTGTTWWWPVGSPVSASPTESPSAKSVVQDSQSSRSSISRRRSSSTGAMAPQRGSQGVTIPEAITDDPTVADQPLGLVGNSDAVLPTILPHSVISFPPVAVNHGFGSPVRSDEPPVSGAIYTDRDGDVVPPIVQYPHFLTRGSSGKAQSDAFTIEVVVNERGEVEAARARNQPRTIGESLFLMNLLSSAKSWRFTPALKGIYPVRYRYRFDLDWN